MNCLPRPSSIFLFCLSALATTYSPVAAQGLPDADALIERYVEAIGGRDAHLAPVSIRFSGTLSIPAMGLTGSFELLQIPDVGSRMSSSLPGLGELMVGFDGEVGWSVDMLTGPQLMEGEELEHMGERALAAASFRDRALVPERATVGTLELPEGACYRVRLGWRSGRETFDCYHHESGLLLRSEDVQVTELGEIPSVTDYSEYREFHGMTLPTRLVQSTMGIEQILEIREVTVDDADRDALTPPAPIQTLMEGS